MIIPGNHRQTSVLTVLVLLACVSAGPAVLAQADPIPQLQIIDVVVDLDAETLTINGAHFDTFDISDPDWVMPRVTVDDAEPPVIHGILHPLTLWPPNHRYRSFTTGDFVIALPDNCTDPVLCDVLIRRVASDEPENGTGDGDTAQDIVIAPDGRSVALRSERRGGGNGRVYTVYLEVADGAGNVGTASFEVHVVDDRHGQSIRDADAYIVEYSPPSEGYPPEERKLPKKARRRPAGQGRGRWSAASRTRSCYLLGREGEAR